MEDYWARSGGLLAEWPLSTSGGVSPPVSFWFREPSALSSEHDGHLRPRDMARFSVDMVPDFEFVHFHGQCCKHRRV